ncbi:ssRNA exonuclease RAT1 [Sporobolomyces koalae]|uniref:ssRNA exonuclease RAT1 n=1 Tax=Sporobolomyces koalae TaxID=500713 RepID=UPI003182678B
MGVPALFRWLSRKYGKIVMPVVEEFPVRVPSASGVDGEYDEMPVDMSGPNPNGEEFDNLYLDMNGIVHPCTHPEGKPAPKNEDEMMKEIFAYTDRVVNMVRPRKLLVMAIDGVAPRAKMNQQRSRRFRAAQEAEQKEQDRQNAIKEWEALGKDLSEEFKGEKAWDSNAITPGTPFMDKLAKSLRYWVRKKLNEDPGWAGLEIIISDASVPGEGEHKIMDFIRRQRAHPSHNPNTKHVIYGLDADLIMLSLATHEPHFKVLREDVFADEKKKGRGCHRCGQPGHHSKDCTGEVKKPEADLTPKGAPAALKPFIFLDVSILREYLAIELSAPTHGFPFSLERAIDDWVFLIFFVGNDFLPHLPSLEIREGAIDTLMGIWKSSLDRMGGYLTEHGKVKLERAQVILEQLAMREDEIFRKRREAEERQDRAEKRRKIDRDARDSAQANSIKSSAQNHSQLGAGNTHSGGIDYVQVQPLAQTSSTTTTGPGGLPHKPSWSVDQQPQEKKSDVSRLVNDNASIVANRKAIRMAGMMAKDTNHSLSLPTGTTQDDQKEMQVEKEAEEKGLEQAHKSNASAAAALKAAMLSTSDDEVKPAPEEESPRGTKRKASADPVTATTSSSTETPVDEEPGEQESDDKVNAFLADSLLPPTPAKVAGLGAQVPPELKPMGNNVVEQEDVVKLWEPGYKERYYRQKFGVELSDIEFRKSIVKSYVEGLCWVLEYYYQGTPSWQWYYPYHFSPFASDFLEMEKLDIQFEKGKPFKPYEQLMGVFPAASKIHLPEPFQLLMTEPDSPIIDFYPKEFHIDMNGKKMLWQGVALLPFIDQDRLLAAMDTKYPQLTDFENHRNTMGNDTLIVGSKHPLFDYLEGLYGKRKAKEPVEVDTKRSKGISGSVLPDESIPGTTFDSPVEGLPDILNDEAISATFRFPDQTTPHRSILLPGVQHARAVLTPYDKDQVRRGGGERPESNGFHHMRQRDQGGPGFAKNNHRGPPPQQQQQYPQQHGQGGYGGGGYQGGNGGGYGYGAQHQQQQQPQGSRDPYNGYSYDPSSRSQGGGAYSGYGGYSAPPPQGRPAYGGYAPPPPAAGYRPPTLPSNYMPPPPPGGYRPPVPPQQQPGGARYPAQQPPSYGGYGGYGGGAAGGQHRRY